MRVVARICLALLALFFVVAIGLYVVLPRVCGGDVVRAHLPEAAISATGCEIQWTLLASRTGSPNRALASGKALQNFTNTQMGGIHLKGETPEDDIAACEGRSRLHSMCG